jgi:hypothetical protein
LICSNSGSTIAMSGSALRMCNAPRETRQRLHDIIAAETRNVQRGPRIIVYTANPPNSMHRNHSEHLPLQILQPRTSVAIMAVAPAPL